MIKQATFGSGCFWCYEAMYQRLNGVISVKSGYSGGSVETPTYEAVCSGDTGHAEVIQITYDPNLIVYDELLEVFWKTHDPTTLNRQGNDVGTQYRSVIFFGDDEQKKLAETYKKRLDEEKIWSDPIVTEISLLGDFYKAENCHEDYFNKNGSQPYCSFVVAPKVKKFKEIFSEKLKDHS